MIMTAGFIELTKVIVAAVVLLVPVGATVASAGEADVVSVAVSRESGDSFRFDVTVRHDDTGWDHYADKWDVVGPDGEVLGTRILHHPHVEEQPFTRSLSGVKVPLSVTSVTLRAHDKVHGYGGIEKTVELPR